jgi:hypothetical protein
MQTTTPQMMLSIIDAGLLVLNNQILTQLTV